MPTTSTKTTRGKTVKLELRLDAELKGALDRAGIADLQHFIQLATKALLEAHRKQLRLEWPLSFETATIPLQGRSVPTPMEAPKWGEGAYQNVNQDTQREERQA
jgi:hypothetical protein